MRALCNCVDRTDRLVKSEAERADLFVKLAAAQRELGEREARINITVK